MFSLIKCSSKKPDRNGKDVGVTVPSGHVVLDCKWGTIPFKINGNVFYFTPSGWAHFWFKNSDNLSMSEIRNRFQSENCDVYGPGHLVIIPPSTGYKGSIGAMPLNKHNMRPLPGIEDEK